MHDVHNGEATTWSSKYSYMYVLRIIWREWGILLQVLVMQFSALNKELSSSSSLLTLTGKKIKQMQEVQVCKHNL